MTNSKQYKVLHSPFSIKVHKKTFINYLEVMIDMYGIIHYAVPSHQEWLINKLMQHDNLTRMQVYDSLKDAGDIISELCKKTHCIAVWDDMFIGKPNKLQMKAICKLRDAGLLHEEMEDL